MIVSFNNELFLRKAKTPERHSHKSDKQCIETTIKLPIQVEHVPYTYASTIE